MKPNNFEAAVAASNEAQAHAQEIQQTRVGGLGGSDAQLVYKIGLNGLASLTATDLKRLCVMLAICEPDTWGGNVYTNAGHAFEEYAETVLPFGKGGYERERKIENATLAKNFKTFAHADFAHGAKRLDIVECKYVQKDTEKVVAEYYAQLQWYYMLGATSVQLYHGTGEVDPFCVEEASLVPVARDEAVISVLLAGVKLLDEAIGGGWRPSVPDKVALSSTPASVRAAFAEMEAIKAQEEELKKRKEAAVATLKEYAEGWGVTSIVSEEGEKKHTVTYTRETVSRTFDAAKLLEDFPKFKDQPEYWKTSKRSASITFK